MVLRLAAGKSAGTVVAWQSGPLNSAAAPAAQPSAYAGSAWTGNAHGSWSVSGVAWAAPPGAASGERKVLLCTCGMNGAAKAWRWDGTQVGPHHKIPIPPIPLQTLTPAHAVIWCVKHCTYLHKIMLSLVHMGATLVCMRCDDLPVNHDLFSGCSIRHDVTTRLDLWCLGITHMAAAVWIPLGTC